MPDAMRTPFASDDPALEEVSADDPPRRITRQGEATTLAVVGLGYVGLPTALAARANDLRIIGIDVSAARLQDIGNLRVDLIPADGERLKEAVDDPNFVLTTDIGRMAEADAVVICVPTPIDEHQNPDLGALRAACQATVEHSREGQVIILTSTSYAGTTRTLLAEPLMNRGFIPGETIYVASSPERIDPGNETYPQGTVARVVGGITHECTRRAAEVLARMTDVIYPVSSPEAAEMTKLLENGFRAVNIAFANEMADVCRGLGLNVAEVIEAAATKPYGFMPFYPGTGVGGHCIPCDPHYLLWQLRAEHRTAPMLRAAMDAIAARPHEVTDQLSRALSARGRGIRGARVLVVGVAYKPGVRDTRESPGVAIVIELLRRRARVDYYDPLVSSISIDDHQVMLSLIEPDASLYDAVLLNTMHPDIDYEWLDQAALVIDPSGRYQLPRWQAAESSDDDMSVDADPEREPERRVAEERMTFEVRR